MKFVLTNMLVLAAAAATIVTLPTAHAESSRRQFLTPSGNIGCQLGENPTGAAYAWCKIDDHSWASPAGDVCPAGNVPGAIGRPNGEDLQLGEGKSPCLGFVMSQLFWEGKYAPQKIDYGQPQSVGPISCVAQESGVQCTDSSTGHFFQVSRDGYRVG